MGSQRVRHNGNDLACARAHTHTHIRVMTYFKKNCLYPTGAIFNNGYVICLAITSHQAISFITGKMGIIVDDILVLSPETYMTSWDL